MSRSALPQTDLVALEALWLTWESYIAAMVVSSILDQCFESTQISPSSFSPRHRREDASPSGPAEDVSFCKYTTSWCCDGYKHSPSCSQCKHPCHAPFWLLMQADELETPPALPPAVATLGTVKGFPRTIFPCPLLVLGFRTNRTTRWHRGPQQRWVSGSVNTLAGMTI